MRCVACNKNLNDYESTRKHAETGEYIDMCNTCFYEIANDVLVVERPDLESEPSPDDWDEDRTDIVGANGNDGLHYD